VFYLTTTSNRQQEIQQNMAASKGDAELATFGAGCFWGTEKFFREEFGANLVSAMVGYMGGASKASYKDVCTGTTNHAEVLQLSYEPNKVAYGDLVRYFFRMHDPTTLNQQGHSRGTQYRSVIFTHTKEQQEIAEQVRDEVQASGKIKGEIVTQIQTADGLQFFEGEPYHQKYLENNPGGRCSHKLYY
jgi:peptide-methionine (S)-S-oxide reductase